MSPVFLFSDVRKGNTVGGTKAAERVAIRAVVVPIAIENTRVRSVVPIARGKRKQMDIIKPPPNSQTSSRCESIRRSSPRAH